MGKRVWQEGLPSTGVAFGYQGLIRGSLWRRHLEKKPAPWLAFMSREAAQLEFFLSAVGLVRTLGLLSRVKTKRLIHTTGTSFQQWLSTAWDSGKLSGRNFILLIALCQRRDLCNFQFLLGAWEETSVSLLHLECIISLLSSELWAEYLILVFTESLSEGQPGPGMVPKSPSEGHSQFGGYLNLDFLAQWLHQDTSLSLPKSVPLTREDIWGWTQIPSNLQRILLPVSLQRQGPSVYHPVLQGKGQES